MSDLTDLLADCPDSVRVTLGSATTDGLWKTATELNDGGGHLVDILQEEHVVIATGSLPGIAPKAAVTITEGAEAGGGVHTRHVKWSRLKDNDRSLTYVFLGIS